jgi:hypothetical protein
MVGPAVLGALAMMGSSIAPLDAFPGLVDSRAAETKMETGQSGRFEELDVLRGAAALCVVLSHSASHCARFFGEARFGVPLDAIYGFSRFAYCTALIVMVLVQHVVFGKPVAGIAFYLVARAAAMVPTACYPFSA